MAHAQKPDFVFRRNGRVHLNRRGASVQSTAGSRVVHISGSNAGYTMFRGSVKSTGYPLHSPVSPSLPLPGVTVCHQVSNALYQQWFRYTFPGTQQGVPTDLLLIVTFPRTYTVHTERTCCFSYLEFHHFHWSISTRYFRNACRTAKSNYYLRHACLSVNSCPLDGFLRNLIFDYFSKICRANSSFTKI